jgi:hypothetical protein
VPIEVGRRGRALSNGRRGSALKVGLERGEDHARIAEGWRALSMGRRTGSCSDSHGYLQLSSWVGYLSLAAVLSMFGA